MEKEEDGEKKKEDDDDDEEEMEGKRRDEEDIMGCLVVQEGMIVKFPLVTVATLAAPVSSFFSSSKKKLRNNIERYTNIINNLLTHKASDHLPLATLPWLPEQCNHCGAKIIFGGKLRNPYFCHIFGMESPFFLEKGYVSVWPRTLIGPNLKIR